MKRLPINGVRAGEVTVIAHALVDADTFEWAAERSWRRNRGGYVVTSKNGEYRYLHRLILELRLGDDTEADHRNGDRLDNRRANLRAVPHWANAQNRGALPGSKSRYIGVDQHRSKWRARGQGKHLGLFDTEEEAAECVREYRRAHMPYSKEAGSVPRGLRLSLDTGRRR